MGFLEGRSMYICGTEIIVLRSKPRLLDIMIT